MSYLHSLVEIITQEEAIERGARNVTCGGYSGYRTQGLKFPNDPYIYQGYCARKQFWVTSEIRINQHTTLLMGTHGLSTGITNHMVNVLAGPEKLE